MLSSRLAEAKKSKESVQKMMEVEVENANERTQKLRESNKVCMHYYPFNAESHCMSSYLYFTIPTYLVPIWIGLLYFPAPILGNGYEIEGVLHHNNSLLSSSILSSSSSSYS